MVETGPSKGNLLPPTVLCAWCVSFFWCLMSQIIYQCVDLAPCGTQFLLMKRQVSIPLILSLTCKRNQILLYRPFLHLCLFGPIMIWYYQCTLPVLVHMTVLVIPVWRVMFPVPLSTTDQSYPSGRIMGENLLGVGMSGLMISTLSFMRRWNWRQMSLVLQMYNECTGVYTPNSVLCQVARDWYHLG